MARQAWQICRGTWRLNTGQRANPGPILVSQGSGAHTVGNVRLFQTLTAAETADNGVELSAEASRVVTGIRSASHLHGSRARCGRSIPAGENAPAEVDLARIQAERDASQRGQERINRQDPIKKSRRRRICRSASPLFRGVTTPDLPEGI